MGAVVIAVVFVAGLLGAPTLFGHGEAHASPPVQQQVASAQTLAPGADANVNVNVNVNADTRAPDNRP